jgi:cell division protein FtsW
MESVAESRTDTSVSAAGGTGHLLAGLVAVLLCLGVQMVLSASLTSRPGDRESVFLGRHLTWLLVSVVAAWLTSRMTSTQLRSLAYPAFWLLFCLLILVLVPGVGARINGAQRWLRIAGFSLQPSELGRLILPMVATRQILKLQQQQTMGISSIPRILLPLALVLPLVAVEPDLGATVFLALGYLLALFFGGWPFRCFFLCGAALLPCTGLLLLLKPYQLRRISGFLETWQDISTAPWQVRQSLYALGAGGLQGTGVGGGWQKLSYLPEANTDFVFAVIGEELGLLGTLTVCMLWIFVYLSGRTVLKSEAEDSFRWVLGTTLLTQLVLQAMANIAVVTALVPPKGVPHPFISYGGTNLLVSLVAIGLILGPGRHSQGHAQNTVSQTDS